MNRLKNKKACPAKLQRRGGFTVLESIVAIFILSLSVSGAFSAVQQSLSQIIIAKDEVKAFYLAQEAVEMIRNQRDGNQLVKIIDPTNSWLYGIAQNASDPCYFGTAPTYNDRKTCRADVKSFSLVNCGSGFGSCPVLNQDLVQGSPTFSLYGYDPSWTATNFTREIQIEPISPNEVAVIVRISWKKGLIPMEFKAKTLLFNWI